MSDGKKDTTPKDSSLESAAADEKKTNPAPASFGQEPEDPPGGGSKSGLDTLSK